MAADLGERIRVARRACGLSQTTVATRLGTDQTTVSAWERGSGPGPRVSQAIQLADMFGVDFVWLATGVGEGPIQAAA